MRILYRISDAGRPKAKLPAASKSGSLANCLEVFDDADFHVFCDNCRPETVAHVRALGLPVTELALGNSGSWRLAIDHAIASFSPDDAVYMVEDDYLHRPGAADALLEGLEIADYVTLYDHPDKYVDFVAGGDNPFVRRGGETSRVMLTNSTHWKTTNSTTMTFAFRLRTMIEDRPIWWRATRGALPKDFAAFMILTQQPALTLLSRGLFPKTALATLAMSLRSRRRLISPIPALATHAELGVLAPLVDWEASPQARPPSSRRATTNSKD